MMDKFLDKLKMVIGLLLYKLMPIEKHSYLFTSFNGHYSDNTRAISEKLHETYPDYKITWLVLDKYKSEVPSYAKAIKYGSIKSYIVRGRATAQIDNVYGFRANYIFSDDWKTKLRIGVYTWLSNKKKQPIYATMHGTAFKKIGRAQNGNSILGFSCPNTTLIVGDKYTEESLKYITFNQCKTDTIGWPRNDILFNTQMEDARQSLKLPKDKKILLFAPTFRNDGKDTEGKNIERSGIDQLSMIDFESLFRELHNKFGGDWIMVCRFHYHVESLVNWNDLSERFPGRIVNGNKFDDMAEYLASSDILMTDTSSCMFDFGHTYRPCLLFFPDYYNFRDKERGFYFDIHQLPFPLAISFEKLINNIRSFDLDTYKNNVDSMIQMIGSMDDGHAAERAVQYIVEGSL